MTAPALASRHRWSALAAVTITVLAWASAFVATRYVGRAFEPGPLTLGRLAVGTVALGVLLLARRSWVPPARREWALLLLCGLAWFAVYNVALNAAEQRVDAGTTAMLVNIGPILIALFAGVLLGEGFPRWLVVGAGVAFAGVLLIGAATATGDTTDLVGALLCVVAAVTYAIGVLAQKPVLRRLPGLQVTFLACTIAMAAVLLGEAPPRPRPRRWPPGPGRRRPHPPPPTPPTMIAPRLAVDPAAEQPHMDQGPCL